MKKQSCCQVERGLLESSRVARRSGLRCDAGVHVTCRKCKVPMQEIKGHIYHRQRKWKCPKCAKIRMQKAAHRCRLHDARTGGGIHLAEQAWRWCVQRAAVSDE